MDKARMEMLAARAQLDTQRLGSGIRDRINDGARHVGFGIKFVAKGAWGFVKGLVSNKTC